MTGKYPARVGVTNFIDWTRGHPSKGKLIDAQYIDHLPQEERENLRQAGGTGRLPSAVTTQMPLFPEA